MTAAAEDRPAADQRPEDAPSDGATDESAPPGTEASGGVERIAAEIRAELAAISSQGLDVRRREQVLKQQYHELERAARKLAADEVEQARQQLRERSAAVEAQAAELAQRRARQNEFDKELRARQLELVDQGAALARRAERWRQRAESLRLQDNRRRQVLRDHIAAVRRHECELESHVQSARDDIRRRQAELNERAAELEAQAARLAAAERDLQARAAESERQPAAARTLEMESRRRALAARERELDRHWQTSHEHRRQLAQQAEELEAQQRALLQEQGAFQERVQRLQRREQRCAEKTVALEAELHSLAEREAELTRREAAVDEVCRQAEETEHRAKQYHEEALSLREQTEARDSESRQAALALVVERQRLDGEKVALESAGAGLDGLGDQREREIEQAHAKLAEQAEHLRQVERSLATGPRVFTPHWWARSGVLAGLAGSLAAIAWLGLHPPPHRAKAEIRVTTDRVFAPGVPAGMPRAGAAGSASAGVLYEHCMRLLDPDLLADAVVGDELAEAWRAGCANSRVRVTAGEGEMVLLLSVTDADADTARRLVRTACEAYTQRVNAVPAMAALPPYYQELADWRAELQAALETAGGRRRADQAALAELPGPQERERALTDAKQTDADLAQVVASLGEQQARVAALLSAEIPLGSVDPADLEAALAEDAVYQEDRAEFHTVATRYRTELGVSMVLLMDPLPDLQKVLAEFAAALTEQRGLNPPAEVSAVLEACGADLAQWQKRLAEFTRQWRLWLETLQGMDVEKDIVALVERQNVAANAARRLSEDARKLVDELAARIKKLDADSAGSTREVVVAAVLRGEQAALKAAVEALVAPAAKTALNENLDLDAHDRKLRGLRTRLSRRRELVNEQLQLAADRLAREKHAARVEAARAQLRDLEQRRDELVTRLMTTLGTIRALDETARRRDEAAARLRLEDAEISRLRAWSRHLEQKLADARRHGPKPDRVQIGELVTEPVEQARYRGAAAAAGVALAAAWLVCVLMTSGNPRRARRRAADGLAKWASAAH